VTTQSGDVFDHVGACLARLDTDRWGAIVHRRDEAALAEARALERRVRRGDRVGPLAGLCFTVKAALSTGDLPATAGSLLLDERVRRPATVVTRLREADAVLVGVTNCAEFALAPDATNRRYGSTINPIAPERTLGGSSAGCAAAVAGGLVPLSVGTDYGGSVRYPAHCTGLFGFRPARRSVPISGQIPTPPSNSPRARYSVPGLLTGDIATLAAALAVFLRRPIVARAPRRIGWVLDGDGATPVQDDIAAALRQTARCLQARPAEEFGANPLRGAAGIFSRIRATDPLEPLASLSAPHPELLTDRMREILAQPVAPLDAAAVAAAAELRHAASRFFATCPVLVAPIATHVAPPKHEATSFSVLAPSRAVSLLGVAAVAVPAGITAEGVPVGVQLVGRLAEILWAAARLADDRQARR
jgi:amidase